MKKRLWEILVPTQMTRNGIEVKIHTRYHRVWDTKVREISGGLTILRPATGHWVSPAKELFIERMIPVRIFCSKKQIKAIADFSAKYYNQQAIMYYTVSREVFIEHYG